MVDIDVITLTVVAIGTFASVLVAIYNLQEPKAEVYVRRIAHKSVKSKIRSVALGEPESVNNELHIIVANIGHKNTKINLPDIILQDEHMFGTYPVEYEDKYHPPDPSALSINCDRITFPYLLIPGDSCEVWTSLLNFADWLKRNGYSGEVAVRFQFCDPISNRGYESGKHLVNVDQVLEQMRST